MWRQTADFADSVVSLFSPSYELQRNHNCVCFYLYGNGESNPKLYGPRRFSKSADIEFARRQRSNSGSSIGGISIEAFQYADGSCHILECGCRRTSENSRKSDRWHGPRVRIGD